MDSIVIDGLKKTYRKGEPPAVDIGGRLTISRGELFGIIGPDGAGKTTLFRMLATLLSPDGGTATLEGLDIVRDYRKIRTMLGYMPGRFSLYSDLSVRENLDFFASVFGKDVESNYGLIEDIYCRLKPFEKRKAGKLSGGMKQKLALCCALVHRPSVLFLDEPTTGVDAVSRKDFWNMLGRIRALGVTIFVSTPYMDEAALCDRLALIRDGAIIGTGTPESIISGFPYRVMAVKGGRMYPLLKTLRKTEGVITCFSFGDAHHLTYDPAVTDRQKVLASIAEKGFGDCSARDIPPCIEDCFMILSSDGIRNRRESDVFPSSGQHKSV